MAKTITCLFCFQIFGVDEALFRCTNARCPDRKPDPIYDDYQGISSGAMGRTFPQPKKRMSLFASIVTNAPCPTCSRDSQTRVCPHCHFELLHDAGLTEEHIVAVIGARSSGKSTYIATLIRRLRNEVGQNFEVSVNGLNDRTRTRYRENFEKPIFVDKRILASTASGSQDNMTKTPMVFRITFGSRYKNRAISLALFDTAGEDMQSLDVMSSEARYICHADAVIFLLDPLQIDDVRDQLKDKMTLPDLVLGTSPGEIVEQLIGLYERTFRQKSTEKIKKPFAFTLSKVDSLYPIIDPSSGLHRTGEHFGFLNLSDLQSIHTEINSYIQTWMGPEFNIKVKNHFSDSLYFGISALGKAPVGGRLETVSSLRVEDPLLWILHKFGLVKTKK